MPLRNDLEAVRDRAVAALDDAHDYYTYTKRAWRTLEQAVQQRGLTFSFHNPATGSAVNECDLFPRAQRYVAEDLASATLQQFVSTFENFLYEALRLWLLAHPRSLSSRQLSGRDILGLPDKAAIVDALVHGQGVANAYYADKAGTAARARAGQPLDVPEPYHQASWQLIRKLVRDIGTGMAAKA